MSPNAVFSDALLDISAEGFEPVQAIDAPVRIKYSYRERFGRASPS